MCFDLAGSAHQGVVVEEIRDTEPNLEAEGTGMVRVFGENGNAGPAESVEMPFPEMRGRVAGLQECLGNGFFLFAKRVAMIENSGSIVAAAGQHCCSGRGTVGGAGVESIEPQSVGSHGIEVRGLQVGVLVVARLSPALIIGHDEDDVRSLIGGGHQGSGQEETKEHGEQGFHASEA